MGGAIVKMLLERGEEVRSFSRGKYSELEKLGVPQYQGDLADGEAVMGAAEGCDIIFHVAAKPGVWGDYDDYYRANVLGTRHVIKACKEHKISKLVYTSTPSVVYTDGGISGGDESLAYSPNPSCHYQATKILAEKMVMEANSPDLAVVSLRPHLIWGPGDNHLVPIIIERGKAGQLRKIGHDHHLVDSVYIDNAAEAHLLAADKLSPDSPIAGKVYFITNGEPVPVWDLINSILEAGGVPPIKRTISPKMAYFAGSVLEGIYHLFRIKSEPRMTRFVAKQLSTEHWFDLSAARLDLGYEPKVSIKEGLKRLGEWLQ